MQGQPGKSKWRELSVLLRGDADSLQNWSAQWDAGRLTSYLIVIIIGAGLFGAAMGLWRSPLQAEYTAIKFPLIILLTATGNAMLNAMLAPLLGLNIPFRQSFISILMSYTITSAIMGSFAPILAFVVWNAPPMSADRHRTEGVYEFILLLSVCIIIFAGVTSNLRLLQLLRKLGGGRGVADRVLFAWLMGNFLLGSQLTWVLRPFFGSPDMDVQFLRRDAMHGSFYETIFRIFLELFRSLL